MDDARGIALPGALIAVSVAARLVSLQWLHPLQWDEVEFFRATDWVRQGLVPYRDFWEHHTPLQWFLFAPLTALLHSPGVAAIVALRWAQLPLWIAAAACLLAWMRGAGIPPFARWSALALALTSSLFMLPAVEYRVDALGGALMIGGLLLLQRNLMLGAGALFALAGFANLRLGPVLVVAMLVALWRYGRRALLVFVGAAVTTALAGLYFVATHSVAIFVKEVFTQNFLADRIQPGVPGIFLHRLAAPFGVQMLQSSFSFSAIDPGGVAIVVIGAIGIVRALVARRKDDLFLLAIVNVANLAFTAKMKYVFNYHFEIAALLAVPFVAAEIARLDRRRIVVAALVVSTTMNVAVALFRGKEADLRYQDLIMREADRLTPPDGTVFDSVGWAIRRKPAYQYWFLREIVVVLEERGTFRPFVPSPPPAAFIVDHDTRVWLAHHPPLRQFVAANYVPVWRELWIRRGLVPAGTPLFRQPPPGVSIDAEFPPQWHVPRLR